MTAEVTVLFFAQSREIAGKKEAKIILPKNITYAELKVLIVEEFDLKPIENSILLALNEEYCASGELTIREGDEIAVIPPLSGG